MPADRARMERLRFRVLVDIADKEKTAAETRQASRRTLNRKRCLTLSQASPNTAVRNEVRQHRANSPANSIPRWDMLPRIARQAAINAGIGSTNRRNFATRESKCS